jgi:DNA-binding XRE family transcriptional regulator
MAYTVETKDIKDEIKEYRKKNGLTQQEMADVI